MAALAIAALAISLSPLAAQERLTGATLPSWTVSGVRSQIDALGSVVTLPSGSQVSRAYTAGRIGVRLLSRPYFSERREGWPALEIGPASLSFVRDPDGGGIVLLGNEALQLPDTIALGPDGRSVRAFDLLFSYDQAGCLALLELDGTFHSVSVRPQEGSIEVALSAGAEADWVIEYLEVETAADALDEPLTGSVSPASADSASADTATQISVTTQTIDSKTIDASLAKIEADDLEGAVDLLGNATATRGTLAWYQMAAMVLIGRAEELKAAGEYRSSRRVASAATMLLEHGLSTAGAAAQPGERAEVFTQLGYVADDHLGARTDARLNFTRALEELPEHAVAKEALARFDVDDRESRLIVGREDGS